MVVEQEQKQTFLRRVKSASFFRNRKREHAFNISLEIIPPLISRKGELSENSSEVSPNISYQSNEILENQASYSKFDIYRDIYELNQKCVLYNDFSKKTLLKSDEILQTDMSYTTNTCDHHKIEKILHEIVETEKSYVRGLEELIEVKTIED